MGFKKEHNPLKVVTSKTSSAISIGRLAPTAPKLSAVTSPKKADEAPDTAEDADGN